MPVVDLRKRYRELYRTEPPKRPFRKWLSDWSRT
jgi:hypothetical protein